MSNPMYINEILTAMDLIPLRVLLVNINYYDPDSSRMETRCTLFQVHNGQHINIHNFMKRSFSHLRTYSIHASKRKILVCDNEDFNCAVVQNYMNNGMNSPLEIYVNIQELEEKGYI